MARNGENRGSDVRRDLRAYCVFMVVVAFLGATAYARNRVWQDEVPFWEDVIKKSPSKARGHNNLGEPLIDMRLYSEAIAHFKRALALKNTSKHRRNLGNAYRRAGMWDEAIVEFKTLIKTPGMDRLPDAYNDMGLTYMEMGVFEDAATAFTEALRLDPNNTNARVNQGTIFYMAGETDRALSEYNAALDIDPRHPLAHLHLGWLLEEAGRAEDAEVHFKRFVDLAPAKYKAVVEEVSKRLGLE